MDLKLAEAGALLRRHQQVARLAGVTALVVLLSTWTSCAALKTTTEARAGVAEAIAVRTTASRLAQQFVPASSGETDEWARTTAEAAEFGTSEALKVSLAQTVSRIAEVAGMSAVKASFSSADAVASSAPRNIGDLAFAPAFALQLEGTGTISETARVILRLPPAAEIVSLSLSGDTGELKATFQLAVYQPTGGPQN